MNRRKKAVALRYDSNVDTAPLVLAKAQKSFVDKMTQLAEKYNITVYKDRDLAEALYALPEGKEIPPDLYQAAAEVIAYCYNLNSGSLASKK